MHQNIIQEVNLKSANACDSGTKKDIAIYLKTFSGNLGEPIFRVEGCFLCTPLRVQAIHQHFKK